MKSSPFRVSVSVVSHGQIDLIRYLLDDMQIHCQTPLEVILTLNLAEAVPFDLERYRFPIRCIQNATPQGFGANHNAAFARISPETEYFCVINPDIRLQQDIFPPLMACLEEANAGIVGPRVLGPTGNIEDSVRKFPTVWSLFKKLLRGGVSEVDYVVGNDRLFPDWVAGMCMLFKRETFRAIGGFDTRYYLYYEDVDICWRLRKNGGTVALEPRATVEHNARRTSRHNLRYLRWHVTSMLRFLLTKAVS